MALKTIQWTLTSLMGFDELEQGAAAPDLEIVGVRTETQDLQRSTDRFGPSAMFNMTAMRWRRPEIAGAARQTTRS